MTNAAAASPPAVSSFPSIQMQESAVHVDGRQAAPALQFVVNREGSGQVFERLAANLLDLRPRLRQRACAPGWAALPLPPRRAPVHALLQLHRDQPLHHRRVHQRSGQAAMARILLLVFANGAAEALERPLVPALPARNSPIGRLDIAPRHVVVGRLQRRFRLPQNLRGVLQLALLKNQPAFEHLDHRRHAVESRFASQLRRPRSVAQGVVVPSLLPQAASGPEIRNGEQLGVGHVPLERADELEMPYGVREFVRVHRHHALRHSQVQVVAESHCRARLLGKPREDVFDQGGRRVADIHPLRQVAQQPRGAAPTRVERLNLFAPRLEKREPVLDPPLDQVFAQPRSQVQRAPSNIPHTRSMRKDDPVVHPEMGRVSR